MTEWLKSQDQLAKMQEQEQKEQADKELATYKKSIADKYDELGKAEKKDKQRILDEIAKLQADWNEKQVKAERDSAKLALQERIKSLEDFKKEYDSAIAEIEKSQQSMADKLSGYGELFGKAKNKLGNEYFKLGDLQKDIDTINQYGYALQKLKDRGVTEDIISEVTAMNVDDALSYSRLLLEKTPEELEKYIALWEEKQRLAADVAKRFYQDEFKQLKAEFVDKIPEELSSIKDKMKEIGKNSAQGLADGFAGEKSFISATFKDALETAITEVKKSQEINSPSKRWAKLGNYMADGLGIGFTSKMNSVARQINNSIPSSIETNATVTATTKINQTLASGMSAIAASMPQSNPSAKAPVIEMDGKVVGKVLFDILENEARVRGKTLFA